MRQGYGRALRLSVSQRTYAYTTNWRFERGPLDVPGSLDRFERRAHEDPGPDRRQNIEKGAVTFTYQGDVNNTIEMLQSVLATEIVCVLRYTMHAVAAAGISSEGVKGEFKAHAREEAEHVKVVAERINQLGGKPNFDPTGLASRAASEYGQADNLVDMIKENLIAERIAVDHSTTENGFGTLASVTPPHARC